MEENNLLKNISSPEDLKKLTDKQIKELCAEIRQKLVEIVSVNGGHLSPNLGTVELTVMLHYIFDSPKDSLVWDVGHQAYVHKMLTGRYNNIHTIRTKGGLSGFPKRSESSHDAFDVGHSSTSISAAYGIARAKSFLQDDSYTIAIIGDGSFTGGLAFEGLNNAGRFKKNFIVILNDNKMSISNNVGAMARYLTSIRIRPGYLRIKQKIERGLLRIPGAGKAIAGALRNSKSKIKNLVYRNTLFDYFGFSYYGPVDGHDIYSLKKALLAAKKVNHPVLLHVMTKKGKGYKFAENDPKGFHGIGSFDIDSGEALSDSKGFSAHFGEAFCELASKNKKIVAITAAMGLGTGLKNYRNCFKDRFFDVGIAEEHAVTFAGGLASKGMLPFFAVYSTFLQRCYDQILHDVAMQKLHVVLCIDRAGVVGEDGETHQGVFDVAMLNSIPNTTVYSPCYYEGLRKSLKAAANKDENLVAVRYPRGSEGFCSEDFKEDENYNIFGNEKSKKLIVTYGRIFSFASEAAALLKQKGIDVCILKLCRIKPIDKKAMDFASGFEEIYFFEEGMQNGGIAETFLSLLSELNFKGDFTIKAINDEFVPHATVSQILKDLSLDKEGIIKTVLKV